MNETKTRTIDGQEHKTANEQYSTFRTRLNGLTFRHDHLPNGYVMTSNDDQDATFQTPSTKAAM